VRNGGGRQAPRHARSKFTPVPLFANVEKGVRWQHAVQPEREIVERQAAGYGRRVRVACRITVVEEERAEPHSAPQAPGQAWGVQAMPPRRE